MALVYLDELKCPCGCGQYIDEAHSRDFNWDVNTTKCFAGQAIDVAQRMFDQQNEGIKGARDGLLWHATPIRRES